MIKISAQDVKLLRDRTGSGMSDCKKALEESGGDMEKAIDFLKKKGLKISLARADRDTTEGLVFASTSDDFQSGVILVVSCETDFVAKTDDYKSLGQKIVKFALSNKIENIDELLDSILEGSSIRDHLTNLTGKVGEKIELKSYNIIKKSDFVFSYLHGEGRIGVLLGLEKISNDTEVAQNIAMQIAAMNPIAIGVNNIDKSIIDREYEIAKAKVAELNKPIDIANKMIDGMVNKYLAENTLLSQAFVKDSSISVEKYLKSKHSDAYISAFYRLSVK